MTTSQTIDGVPGLRALLAEIYNHHGTTTDHCDRIRPLLMGAPAAKSQGETVTMDGKTTIREYVANSVPEDQISDDWTKGYEECKRRIHQMFQQPVNAKQPAPVAVVMPSRIAGDHLNEMAQGWNSCIDAVNRLNDINQ